MYSFSSNSLSYQSLLSREKDYSEEQNILTQKYSTNLNIEIQRQHNTIQFNEMIIVFLSWSLTAKPTSFRLFLSRSRFSWTGLYVSVQPVQCTPFRPKLPTALLGSAERREQS